MASLIDHHLPLSSRRRTRLPYRGTRPPSHLARGGNMVRPLQEPVAYDHTQPLCFPPPLQVWHFRVGFRTSE